MNLDTFNPFGLFVKVVGLLLVLGLAWGSWFVVDPSERAGLRTLGTVTTKEPLGPGLHFKMPYISTVDEVQVSLTTLHVEPFLINTVDNQRIKMEINVTYDIPDDAVFHLLYGVGKSGNAEIKNAILPIIQDRVGRVISSKNTNSISLDRESIQAEIIAGVSKALKDIFRIRLDSLQIAQIQFSDAFVESNNRAVLAKNEAVQAENYKRVVEYQAQQKVIVAEGQAREQIALAEAQKKSAILKAEGAAQSVILEATADKTSRELRGQGEAARLAAEAGALGGPERYIALQNTMVMKNWNGSVPTNVMNVDPKSPLLFQLPNVK